MQNRVNDNVNDVSKDNEVDGSLPLDSLLKPDLELRDMLRGLKMTKWVFTNAYLPVSM